MKNVSKNFQTIIRPKDKLFNLKLGELFSSRELIWLFVKRDFLAMYKQTILGPLWFIINPLITTLIFTIVFGNIANLPTDEAPDFLFYMSSNIVWTYFATCLSKNSNTFVSNARLFGKVYFPRLITPISTTISAMINFGVQFIMYLCFVIYYTCVGAISPNAYILITPVLIITCALLSIGLGIIVSSLTTKYRDLSVLVGFGITLWMYLTPVVYPASQIDASLLPLFMLNPMAPIIEAFRYAFLGAGMFSWGYLGISFLTTLVVLTVGIVLFGKVERTFMDTI
ncbi:MAG: ABC transporter permease [Ruminococcaceae bacterium]|nr:ABC transporter permease [Oscillospiraceae bacterium]